MQYKQSSCSVVAPQSLAGLVPVVSSRLNKVASSPFLQMSEVSVQQSLTQAKDSFTAHTSSHVPAGLLLFSLIFFDTYLLLNEKLPSHVTYHVTCHVPHHVTSHVTHHVTYHMIYHVTQSRLLQSSPGPYDLDSLQTNSGLSRGPYDLIDIEQPFYGVLQCSIGSSHCL